MVNDEDWKPYDPSQEPIFPPELLVRFKVYMLFMFCEEI